MAKLQEMINAQPGHAGAQRSTELKTLSPAAVRALIFGKQKLRTDEDVEVIGANADGQGRAERTASSAKASRFTD